MENKIQPKLSVIIPVYKAEQFIERCCKSLFEQTLDSIEYIFVDDCSPDNSVAKIREIASRYPEREPMVKILTHTPNRGVSFSRQQGLEAATGEFVIHCDSDDWVDLDMYKSMYDTAIRDNADVVCCDYVVEYADGRQKKALCNEKDLCSEIVFNLAPQTGSLWSKIVRLSNLRNAKVSFPMNTNWGEDFCVSIAGLILSKKTVCLSECFYHYWQNSESITHTISPKRCDELLTVADYVTEFLTRTGRLGQYAFELNSLKYQCKAPLLMFPEVRDINKWKRLYTECHKDIMKYNYPLYLRMASVCIINNMGWIGRIILKTRDIISNCKR